MPETIEGHIRNALQICQNMIDLSVMQSDQALPDSALLDIAAIRNRLEAALALLREEQRRPLEIVK